MTKIKRLLALILCMACLMSLTMPVMAGDIGWSGGGGGGSSRPSGGGSGSTIDYGRQFLFSWKHGVCGYRFTYIKANGEVRPYYDPKADGAMESLDIYLTAAGDGSYSASNYYDAKGNPVIGYRNDSGVHTGDWAYGTNDGWTYPNESKYYNENQRDGHAYRMWPKQSKLTYSRKPEPHSGLSMRNFWDDEYWYGCIQELDTYKELTLENPLPRFDGEVSGCNIQEWCTWPENLDIIARWLDCEKGLASMVLGDKIIVEPIYLLYVCDEWVAMTISELAVLSQDVANYIWTEGAYVYGWHGVAVYTNRHFPNQLYTVDTMGLWEPASAIASGDRMASYYLAKRGYGVGIAWANNTAPVDVATTAITLKDSATGAVLDPAKLTFGQTVRVYYTFANYSTDPKLINGYDTNGNLIANQQGLAPQTEVEVHAGEFTVNWVGENKLTGECYIYDDETGTELDVSKETDAQNNFYELKLQAKHDLEISEIILRDEDGQTLTDWDNIPYDETVSVYHVYKNNAKGALNVNAYYGSKSNPKAVVVNGATSFVLGGGATKEILVETYTATGQDAVSKSLYGAIYAQFDSNHTMTNETNKNNNEMSISVGSKYDLAITDIAICDQNGTRCYTLIDGVTTHYQDMYVGQTYQVYHRYTSDTPKSITVNTWSDGVKTTVNGSDKVTLTGKGKTDAKLAGTITQEEPGIYTTVGEVYVYGQRSAAGETNEENNILEMEYEVKEGLPWLEVIVPNEKYRQGTDVITSYWLHNDTGRDFTPDMGLKVRMRVYNAKTGEAMKDSKGNDIVVIKDVICPAHEQELVWFRWTVPSIAVYPGETPEFYIEADFFIEGETDDWTGMVNDTYGYKRWIVEYTPDTDYERAAPTYWSRPRPASVTSAAATWSEWLYEDGQFVKHEVGVLFENGTASITPTSVTAYRNPETGVWTTKSGYGFSIELEDVMPKKYGNYDMPTMTQHSYTLSQYCYAKYPEFMYKDRFEMSNGIATLERTDIGFELYEFSGDYHGETLEYGRVHWIPIWYPDGRYYTQLIQEDIWTPVGCFSIQTNTEELMIEGNMYDDWYIGHG